VNQLINFIWDYFSIPTHTFSMDSISSLVSYHPWIEESTHAGFIAVLSGSLIFIFFSMMGLTTRKLWVHIFILFAFTIVYSGYSQMEIANPLPLELISALCKDFIIVLTIYLIFRFWIGAKCGC